MRRAPGFAFDLDRIRRESAARRRRDADAERMRMLALLAALVLLGCLPATLLVSFDLPRRMATDVHHPTAACIPAYDATALLAAHGPAETCVATAAEPRIVVD